MQGKGSLVTVLSLLSYVKAFDDILFSPIIGEFSGDDICKKATIAPLPLAPDVEGFSPFYVVAATRTRKTEQIDNICNTYFGQEPFLNIISIVYRDGSHSQIVLEKGDIPDRPGVAVAKAFSDDCLFRDYTLIPACNNTAFVLYRCFICGDCSDLDVGPSYGVDTKLVLVADPNISPECTGDLARRLSDTSELGGKDFLILPFKHLPRCITTYTTPDGFTLHSYGADRARDTLRQLKDQKKDF